jgi:NAD(P)H dehydrogenase (quinone)
MKTILIINGNPKEHSLSKSIVDSYKKGAENAAKVEVLHLNELTFNINQTGPLKLEENELEASLIHAQNLIKIADHIVWVYPIWWGGMPALLKGFIDRTFLSGFAFQYRKDSMYWDKLLSGKTSRIIVTMDAPSWYFRFILRNHSLNQLKKSILNFCGIKVKGVSYFGKVRFRKEKEITDFLVKMTELGKSESI